MSQTLNETPSANRLHIAIYGKRNSGKSSLINALTNQDTALISPVAGTTTDPVFKAMEVRGLGACVLIDTAGFDDEGELGSLRTEKTRQTVAKADIALLVLSGGEDSMEREWYAALKERHIPIVVVISKADCSDTSSLAEKVRQEWETEPVIVSAVTRQGIDGLLTRLAGLLPEDYEAASITGALVRPGDVVMLVMPQDSEAPKGRLILPQVQTTRDLLDQSCIIVSVTPAAMPGALAALKEPPALIITDSQAFREVSAITPPQSRLTSFSILFAAYKGDLKEYIRGAEAVDSLTEASRVLIAEACTHAPLSEDIGRVKIPALLRKRFGQGLTVDITSGGNFPADLSGYDLIVHCGGCMFNRKYLLSRIEQAKGQGVPITNYGVLLAKLNGILEKVALS